MREEIDCNQQRPAICEKELSGVRSVITLADNASNVTAIYINNGKKVVIK